MSNNDNRSKTAILPTVPRLRVFRELEMDRLSEEFLEKVNGEEGTLPYVDANKARDFPFTEEIMETTIGAILVDPEGSILAKFSGPDGFLKAEKAKDSARVTFDLELDDADADLVEA